MELGAIGELVGGVAVIASLIYVGLQVRQSNRQAQQRIKIEQNESDRQFARESTAWLSQLSDPELANLFRRGLSDFSALSRDDQLRFDMYLSALGSLLSLVFARELVEEPYNRQWLVWFSSLVKSEGGGRWWAETKPRYFESFQSRIDALAADPAVPVIADLNSWFALSPDENAAGA